MGGGGRENASGRFSSGHGASHTVLALSADQTLGKEFSQVQPCLSGSAKGRGSAGDMRATSRSPRAHKVWQGMGAHTNMEIKRGTKARL